MRGKYRDVILPMTVLRRLDAVLEGSKQAVLDMKATLDDAGVVEQDPALRQAAGQAFYNTSRFTLRDLRARANRQQLTADFQAYLDGFSPNVQDILENFEFRNQIPRLSRADALGTLIEKLTSPDINLSPDPLHHADGSVKHHRRLAKDRSGPAGRRRQEHRREPAAPLEEPYQAGATLRRSRRYVAVAQYRPSVPVVPELSRAERHPTPAAGRGRHRRLPASRGVCRTRPTPGSLLGSQKISYEIRLQPLVLQTAGRCEPRKGDPTGIMPLATHTDGPQAQIVGQ